MVLKRSATHLPTSNKFWFWDIALICSSTRCESFWLLYISGNLLIKWTCAPTGLRCWRLYGKLCGHYSARNCALGFSPMDMVCGTCLVHLVSCPDCNTISGNIGVPWRTMNFTTWLNSSRRDAAIAHSVNLQVTDTLINKLREQARDLSAWETTIMCGGIWAEAHCKPSERPHICPQCEERMIPSVHHILWECSMWSHLRLLPCPTNDLTSRLGWNQHGACLPILRQCGNIRREHVKLPRTKRYAGGRRGPGAPSLSEDIWAGNLALLSRVTMQRRWWWWDHLCSSDLTIKHTNSVIFSHGIDVNDSQLTSSCCESLNWISSRFRSEGICHRNWWHHLPPIQWAQSSYWNHAQ